MNVTNLSLRLIVLASAVLSLSGPPLTAQQRTAVLMKGDTSDILLVGPDQSAGARLTQDPRRKGSLRWLPDGAHLSYFAGARPKGALGRLTIIDLKGNIEKEVLIRPDETAPASQMRFIEYFDWISNTRVKVEGSFGPWNGEYFELDVNTGKESQPLWGRRFLLSPDQAHVAHLDVHAMGPEEEHRDRVLIDERGKHELAYPPEGITDMVLVSDLVWSPDSKRVAFLEQQVELKQVGLSVLSVSGQVVTVRLPDVGAGHQPVEWLDTKVIVGEGPGRLLVDPQAKTIIGLLNQMDPRIERIHQAVAKEVEAKKAMEVLVLKLGGTEGVTWHPQR